MYKRINKKAARKLYNNNVDILIIPHKCNPLAAWFIGITLNNNGRSFDSIVNEFIYYNCNYAMGYYPAFYMEVTK